MTPPIDLSTCETHFCEMDDGAKIAFRRWSGPKHKRIVISHGNGLAVDGFAEFGAALAAEFEIVAFDMRNHGMSPQSPHPDDPWPRYIADVPLIYNAISETFGEKETHGAFHSMASACTLIAQSLTPSPWSTLTLFEPPIRPAVQSKAMEDFDQIQASLSARAAKRRRTFPSPAKLAASFERAPSFGGIPKSSIERLAAGSVFERGTNSEEPWELVLMPEAEALNFIKANDLHLYWDGLSNVKTPVQIITGDRVSHDMPYLIDIADIMAMQFGFPIASVAGTNHFMQLQEPELCAQHIFDFVKKNKSGKNSVDNQA
ncbi:alpha/beta fold hydrolase [Celeribacter halophilus]|uniref:alpha/beta fold hydrolase n=1 Tax=Celeribacter halophilus TaxID=576117 RepID=UPI001C0A06FE|nr:alpha/beta hydrolase [Celeribacter halophilus]MBU2891380.1 alpha/beta hydrolase [Celeribacter halophilus]MDO6512396.1 alpha/beta hydrolase [Celeribacter halophilus]